MAATASTKWKFEKSKAPIATHWFRKPVIPTGGVPTAEPTVPRCMLFMCSPTATASTRRISSSPSIAAPTTLSRWMPATVIDGVLQTGTIPVRASTTIRCVPVTTATAISISTCTSTTPSATMLRPTCATAICGPRQDVPIPLPAPITIRCRRLDRRTATVSTA